MEKYTLKYEVFIVVEAESTDSAKLKADRKMQETQLMEWDFQKFVTEEE